MRRVTISSIADFVTLMFRFIGSIITGPPFPDPHGRYRRGGGINVPVRLTIKLARKETIRIQSLLSKVNVISFIDKC